MDDFLETNKEDLIKLYEGLESPSFKSLNKTLDKVIKDCSQGKGNNCKTLGDTIICLEAPKDYPVYSINEKDFALICKLLCKKFVPL